jgi:hypothetical protein
MRQGLTIRTGYAARAQVPQHSPPSARRQVMLLRLISEQMLSSR